MDVNLDEHYLLIIDRINQSTIRFTYTSTEDNLTLRYGYAHLQSNFYISKNFGQSELTVRKHPITEFKIENDTCKALFLFGIDYIGSGDRLLARSIVTYNGNIRDVRYSN